VAKSEKEMKEMMKNLGKYVRKKNLEMNVEKTRMMVFNKRKRKSEKNDWNWKRKEFKYLGYRFNVRALDKDQRGSEESKQSSGMCVGNRREKEKYLRGVLGVDRETPGSM
jgi:hypothetical protein